MMKENEELLPAVPGLAEPCRAAPCLPRLDVAIYAQPRLRCRAMPRRAGPGLAMPAIPCPALPCHAKPGRASHDSPGHARPRQA